MVALRESAIEHRWVKRTGLPATIARAVLASSLSIRGHPVNKHKKLNKPPTLQLKKQTIVILTPDLLAQVAGGNNSTRPSQCPTLCF